MKITYEPGNNFHNFPAIALRVTGEMTWVDGDAFEISKNQAKRIEKHFCGISGCTCAKGHVIPLDAEGTRFAIAKKWCE